MLSRFDSATNGQWLLHAKPAVLYARHSVRARRYRFDLVWLLEVQAWKSKPSIDLQEGNVKQIVGVTVHLLKD